MTENYPENSVVLRMEPLSWCEDEYFESISHYDTLKDAKHHALHFSCMAGTRTVHVYGEGGELAYSYDRATNIFYPVSESAKAAREAETAEMWKEMLSKKTGKE